MLLQVMRGPAFSFFFFFFFFIIQDRRQAAAVGCFDLDVGSRRWVSLPGEQAGAARVARCHSDLRC